jgi:hypothetical protein
MSAQREVTKQRMCRQPAAGTVCSHCVVYT